MSSHHTTSTRTRLLWLLGLATAATGTALLLSAGESRADNTPRPNILGSVTQLADHTARNTLNLPAAVTKPAGTSKPRPVRNLLHHAGVTVDTATTNVTTTLKAATDTADQATQPLPIVGRAVDKATDLTDATLDHTPALTPPPAVDPAPAPQQPDPPRGGGGSGSDDTPVSSEGEGAPATPAPASEQPHSPTASTGVPHHPNAGDVTNAPRTHTAPAPTALTGARPTHLTPAGPTPPASPETSLGDPSAATSAPNHQRQHHDADSISRWTSEHCRRQAHTHHQAHRGGRTLPPPAPSG